MQVIEDGVRHVRRDAEQPRRLRDGEAQSGHFLVLPTHSQRERGDGHFERRPATRTPGTPAREECGRRQRRMRLEVRLSVPHR